MSTIISTLADNSIGGTFLSWSLHYLNNHNEYFLSGHSVNNSYSCIKELVDNPLNSTNSHKFLANQSITLEQVTGILDDLKNQPTESFHHTYTHFLFNAFEDIADSKTAFNKIAKSSTKNILLYLPYNHVHYYISQSNRAKVGSNFFDQGKTFIIGDENLFNNYIEYFFPEIKTYKHETIGELREIYALTFSFFSFTEIFSTFDKSIDHFLLNAVDLWNNFDHSVNNLFDYLELDISKDRYQKWVDVYYQWRKIHQPNLKFSLYFDTIIEYILNNYYLDLTQFNLDIIQEASIQHYLIHNHNLNLKCWQLDKFIDTKQLHNLLEPNTHQLRLHKSVLR